MFSRFTSSLFVGAVASFLTVSTIHADIAEIDKIESLRDYLRKDTLVLLNVGDTLFSPSSMLSDNQWREYFVERANEVAMTPEAAKVAIDEVKALIVEKVPKATPESVTAAFVANLQREEIPILGFSKRCFATTYAPNNDLITYNQLLKLDIDLVKTLSFYPAEEYQNDAHAFKYGMIFTNKNPIGPAILEFLANNNLAPAYIIVVGDELIDLEEAEQSLSSINIAFQGLRYGYIDERKKAFDKDLGTIQFFAFYNEGKLLSDEEALQIREADPNFDYSTYLDEWIRQKS